MLKKGCFFRQSHYVTRSQHQERRRCSRHHSSPPGTTTVERTRTNGNANGARWWGTCDSPANGTVELPPMTHPCAALSLPLSSLSQQQQGHLCQKSTRNTNDRSVLARVRCPTRAHYLHAQSVGATSRLDASFREIINTRQAAGRGGCRITSPTCPPSLPHPAIVDPNANLTLLRRRTSSVSTTCTN